MQLNGVVDGLTGGVHAKILCGSPFFLMHGTPPDACLAHPGSFAFGVDDFAGHLWKPWKIGRSPWKRRFA